MEEVYFGTKDGDLIDRYEISKIAYLTTGIRISTDDISSIREFSKTCKGISGEIKRPSVKWLVQHGHKVKAVKIYYKIHSGISLKEAKEIVDSMEEKCRNSKGENK